MSKQLVFIVSVLLLLGGCTGRATATGENLLTGSPASNPMPPQITAQIAASPAATVRQQPAAPLGNTYHVAIDGNDGHDGSAGAPWLTIQHAVDSVQPGDLILVHAGTYAGARLETSGTATAPLTLRANPGDTPIINQPGPNNRHGSNLELETWEGDAAVAYWVIEGFEVTGALNWGIDVRGNETAHSHHIVIRTNVVHDNGWTGGDTGIFAAFTDYVTIENNESYHNGEHGIYVNNSSDFFTIRGNRVHHNADSGIHLNGDLSSGGDGLMTDGLVENNVIFENGTGGGAGINMDGVNDSIVQNNLIYSNHASGIAIFQENGAECSQNNRIWHNTVLMPADGRWAIIIADPACVDNQLYNNIFYSAHSYRGSINLPVSSVSGFESDYNIVTDRFTTNDGDTVITLAAWQALGYGAHSFIAAPGQLFVDAANADYHLQEGSPAIDAGRSLPEVTADLEGTPRPYGSGYDIGAYEFHGAGAGRKIYLPTVLVAPGEAPLPLTAGHILYRLSNDQHLYRLAIPASGTPGAPEDLTLALNPLAAGIDDWINLSPDGNWLLLSTERAFSSDCAGWSCLVLLPNDLSSGELLVTPNGVIHPEEFSAVASGGNLVVYSYGDGPHTIDLWAVTRQGSGWSAPVLLTAASPFDHHSQPAISADGSTVVFNCDPDMLDGQQGTAVCEVGTDGTGFRTVIGPEDGPGGAATHALRQPDYAPDGSIVFEADWYGEQIWRISPGGTAIRITDAFNNDNSPCVLPDGRIVSLWLDRAGGNGDHEIKVMAADGSASFMALTGLDVFDLGLGCGE